MVEGASADAPSEHDHDALLRLLLEEVPVKSAAKIAAALSGASRNALYARALELKDRPDGEAGDQSGRSG